MTQRTTENFFGFEGRSKIINSAGFLLTGYVLNCNDYVVRGGLYPFPFFPLCDGRSLKG